MHAPGANLRPGRGGGGATNPHFGSENGELRSGLEREMGVSGADLYRTRLAGTLAGRKPWGAARTLCVRAGCSKPAVGGDECLEREEILKMTVSGAATKN